jgi:hypothetical protein
MHLKKEDIELIEIAFDSGLIPPPYSHYYKLKIGIQRDFLDVALDLVYTDRDEVTEEEIKDEGFTLHDDFHFNGEVPSVWKKPLMELYSKTRWSNKKLDDEGGIGILTKDSHGQEVYTVPLNQEEWQFFAQDVIQAIYEITKKEAPLKIGYLIQEEGQVLDLSLTVLFSVRKVEVRVNGKAKEADWDMTKELLSFVFLPDYDYDRAKQTKPQQKGHFIDCGDGFWHEVGKGVINIDDSFDAVGRIKDGFKALALK